MTMPRLKKTDIRKVKIYWRTFASDELRIKLQVLGITDAIAHHIKWIFNHFHCHSNSNYDFGDPVILEYNRTLTHVCISPCCSALAPYRHRCEVFREFIDNGGSGDLRFIQDDIKESSLECLRQVASTFTMRTENQIQHH